MNEILIAVVWMISCAFIAVGAGYLIYLKIFKEKVRDVAIMRYVNLVRKGVKVYLRQQYKLVALITMILFFTLIVLSYNNLVPKFTPYAALTGIIFTVLAGYIAVVGIMTKATAYTADYSKISLKKAYNVSYLAGCSAGLITQGLILLDLGVWWFIIYSSEGGMLVDLILIVTAIGSITTTFGVGASSYAMVARVAGGVYTKGADVGGDTAGKLILGLPEDSASNPGTLADSVGDHVGDGNGGFADLYESAVGSLVSSTLLAAVGYAGTDLVPAAALFPILIFGCGVVASLFGMYFSVLRNGNELKIVNANQNGLFVATFMMVVFSYVAAKLTIGVNAWYPILIGLAMANLLNFMPEYFTSHRFAPILKIARNSHTGAASAVTGSLENGFRSSAYTTFIIAVGIIITYAITSGTVGMKLCGIANASVAMLSMLAFILASDAQGPIVDNAQAVNEITGADEKALAITNKLDAMGNTSAAKLKGFSIGSAAMTALVLISAYLASVQISMNYYGIHTVLDLSVTNSMVMSGMFIGGAVIYLFTAGVLNSVMNAASALVDKIIEEAKHFMKDGKLVPGVIPDYDACVIITTKAAQKSIVAPIVLVFTTMIATGLIGGPEMVTGVLVGGLVVGILCGLFQTNAGGAADNNKKLIESGQFGGKGSEAYKAAVVADTVGDPLKDASGPSINIIIKLMSMIAMVAARSTVKVFFRV